MDVQTKKENVRTEGFEGILYPGNVRKDKVLIVMSGSNGGMKLTRQAADFYQQNGFPALALALFKINQTPKDMSPRAGGVRRECHRLAEKAGL